MNLLEVTQKMVLDSDIGARNVASRIGKKYHVLLNELSPENYNHKLGADLLIPLMNACRSVMPLHHLSAQMNGVFISLPDIKCKNTNLVRAVKEFGDLISAYGEAVDNLDFTKKEKERILKEGHEALTAIQELLYGLEALPSKDF